MVKYKLFNGTENFGYYSKEGLIRETSPVVSCDKEVETFFNIDGKNQLIRNGQIIDVKLNGVEVSEILLNLDDQMNNDSDSTAWFYEKVSLNYPLVRNGLYSLVLDIIFVVTSILSLVMGIKMLLRSSKTRLIHVFSVLFKEMIVSYNNKLERLEQNILPLNEKIDLNYEQLEGQLKKIIYAPPPSAPFEYESFYPELSVSYNENTKKIQKEAPPYIGEICKACGFVSVSNRGNLKK